MFWAAVRNGYLSVGRLRLLITVALLRSVNFRRVSRGCDTRVGLRWTQIAKGLYEYRGVPLALDGFTLGAPTIRDWH